MLDLIKKGFFASIGAVVLTTEKIQESIKKLVEEGKISTEEGEKLAQDLVKSGERQWEELNAKVAERARKFSESLEVVKRKDFDELEARVTRLEENLGLIHKKLDADSTEHSES